MYPYVYNPTYHYDPFRNAIPNPNPYPSPNNANANTSANARAHAEIKGSPLAPNLRGYVKFTDVPNGTRVSVRVMGLPSYQEAQNDQAPIGPHGFHIHEDGACSIGDNSDPYQSAGGHWSPDDQPHGNHAGDFPVLFSNNGHARMTFFTDRFKSSDVTGKSIIIHQNPDDYRTQPAGDAGKRIGCGVINAY
ncbi:superoxide dismutase family protein [Barrientosiimonas marina]